MPDAGAVAILVDAFHSGTQFIPELAARGIGCVHVQTRDWPPSMYPQLTDDPFLAVLRPGQDLPVQDLTQTLDDLRQYRPVCVLAGSESGVELADQIADGLDLPGNELGKSHARRDKYAMANAVSKAGLRTIRQVRCTDIDSAVTWAAENISGQAVVKPLDSAGTDDVFFCETPADIRRRAAMILGHRHHLGVVNRAVLVQEFIEGSEYIVDTVSCDGDHRVTAIWLYHKHHLPGVTAIYDWDELVDPRSPEAAPLIDYTKGVLDALDIRYGPAHTEIMVDKDGPVLIECGARLDGLEYLPLAQRCFGTSQLQITCDAYLDRGAFQAGPDVLIPRARSINVVLITHGETVMATTKKLSQIEALPSFAGLLLRAKPGDRLPVTVDYQTAPGVVFLAHEDRNVIESDLRQLRKLEAGGLFSPDTDL